jgi:protease II
MGATSKHEWPKKAERGCNTTLAKLTWRIQRASLLPRLVAWGEDTSGSEKYTLRVREVATGREVLARPIPDTAGNFAFANDNRTLFYVTKDKLDRWDGPAQHRPLRGSPKPGACCQPGTG